MESEHDRIISMSENIRELLTEFKNMNGKLVRTKKGFEKHERESKYFRKKVNEIWAIIQTVKWIIGLVLSSAIIYKIWLEYIGR